MLLVEVEDSYWNSPFGFFLVHRYFSVLTNTHRLWPMVRSKFLIRTHHKYVASEFYLLFLCVCIRNENVTLRVNISTWQKTKLNKKENKQTETVKTKWMEEFVQFERRIRILWKTKKKCHLIKKAFTISNLKKKRILLFTQAMWMYKIRSHWIY